ncbi:MAG: EAL domain-containing protein [Leptospiraceae bacterium]|nr:EAL domain-containing protein [Leptospiraceae bacterium]
MNPCRLLFKRLAHNMQINSMEFQYDDSIYKVFFENSTAGIFLSSPAGRYLLVNERLAAIYGFGSPAEMKEYFHNIKTELYIDPERRDEFVQLIESEGAIYQFESQIRRKDGQVIWISENARLVRDDQGRTVYYEGTVVDITSRKAMEAEVERQQQIYEQLFNNSPLATVLVDQHRNAINCNAAFEQLFGLDSAEISGRALYQKIIPPELIADAENHRVAILSGHSAPRETERLHRDGSRIPVSIHAFPVIRDNVMAGLYYIYEDITERKEYENTIRHQAFYDSLTGLPNRNLFTERLNHAVERLRRRGSYQFALVLMDMNNFKRINDTLGHQMGDKFLAHVAGILQGAIRTVDTAARLGGDEFAILLEEFQSQKDVMYILERVHQKLGLGVEIDGHQLQASGSMGIVMDTANYSSSEDLVRDADIAMYHAKEHGKPWQFFNFDMQRELLEITAIERELEAALTEGQFQLYYQPIVSLTNEQLQGFEALIRWEHPQKGMIPPERFIPIAEDTGLILAIGNWVLEESCRQMQAWNRENPANSNLWVSVNVSLHQFTRIDLASQVSDILTKYNVAPSQIRIELTESLLMRDPDLIVRVMHRLRELGVKLAIDDFGTGYSSLSYLNKLPIDVLKIDRSFINGSQSSGDTVQIIRSLTTLARNLGLSVVAEGVEEYQQRDLLRDLHCDNAQGYLYSRPMKPAFIQDWIRDQGHDLLALAKN